MPDLPELPADDHQPKSDEDTLEAEDNDTTLVISTDEEVLSLDHPVPTLELPSDEGETEAADVSTESEIPTGYNSETGEIYQNQLADPVVAAKLRREI